MWCDARDSWDRSCGGLKLTIWARGHTWVRVETCALAFKRCAQAHKDYVLLHAAECVVCKCQINFGLECRLAPCTATDSSDLSCALFAGQGKTRPCKKYIYFSDIFINMFLSTFIGICKVIQIYNIFSFFVVHFNKLRNTLFSITATFVWKLDYN